MKTRIKELAGWFVAIVVGTISVLNFVQAPVDSLKTEIGNRLVKIEGEHTYYNEKLDKSFQEFKIALDKQQEATVEMGKAIVQLQTVVGTFGISIRNNAR